MNKLVISALVCLILCCETNAKQLSKNLRSQKSLEKSRNTGAKYLQTLHEEYDDEEIHDLLQSALKSFVEQDNKQVANEKTAVAKQPEDKINAVAKETKVSSTAENLKSNKMKQEDNDNDEDDDEVDEQHDEDEEVDDEEEEVQKLNPKLAAVANIEKQMRDQQKSKGLKSQVKSKQQDKNNNKKSVLGTPLKNKVTQEKASIGNQLKSKKNVSSKEKSKTTNESKAKNDIAEDEDEDEDREDEEMGENENNFDDEE